MTLDKIEKTITAGGISCRNCVHVRGAALGEPTCIKHVLPVQASLATGKAISINRFCSLVRQPGQPCGPEGQTYELRVAT